MAAWQPRRQPDAGPHLDVLAQWSEAEFDTPEEVDAVYRAQRRLSFLYGGLFLAITLAIPLLHGLWPAWSSTPLWGGFTPAYLAVAVVYPVGCVLLAIAYTVQANRLEEDLLGRPRRRE